METLEQLKEQRKELEQQLRDNWCKINAINQEKLFKQYGVEIGSLVTINGINGSISRNDGSYIYFCPLKKDGTPGLREHRVWSFDKLTVLPQTPKDI